ncbi:glycerol uptake facilitator protein [Propionibacterium cyclohexanicum]|uniref:Glycerol uptake facilitator protein n=2 Tax=Propionibacterium cyclohexanicum TaxID=64702 RepID=A0A1H9PND0_9ACTN|nr:glycerol uptake facilitator protein [Propionibacterium cyclohexanicum]
MNVLAVSPAGIFGSEFLGTMLLIVLGVGVVANALLPKTKGHDGGWQMIDWGWGIGVMVGVFAAYRTGGHLNPAVTLGLTVAGVDLAPGIPATFANVSLYIGAQLLGAMAGAVLAWLVYKQHYDLECDPSLKLGTFATGPQIRNYGWNLLTETIATYVLVIWVLLSGYTNVAKITTADNIQEISGSLIGPLGVTFLIMGIGNSLGGPTGYAINPARDLGPRIVHALLPIKGKGSSDWAYSWVPILGPILGGVLAGLTYLIFW